MTFTQIAPLVGSAITLALGLMGLLNPSAAARFTHLEPKGLLGISEIRATYGGFFLALGLTCFLLRTPTAYSVAGLAWIGAAGGRTFSVLVDRNTSAQNLGGILFEGVIGALLLVGGSQG